MGMHVNSALPDPAQIKEELPLAPELKALKAKRDAEIRDVFTGVSNKFLVIVGPCSADNEDAVCEYTSRLGELAREVSDKLLIIPRIYTNKPRTRECSLRMAPVLTISTLIVVKTGSICNLGPGAHACQAK